MARANLIKSTFTSGVLDPRLYGRVDIGHYEKGLQQGTNCIITPYGNARRRPGLKWCATLTNPGNVSPRLLGFAYKTRDKEYCLVLGEDAATPTQGRMFFFLNGAQITNINGSGNPWLTVPWPVAASPYVRMAQSQDAAVLVHEDYAPRVLARGTADNLWTITAITFTNIPQIDYNDASSPAATSEVQTLTFAGGPAVGNTYRIDLEGVLSEVITWADDATADGQAANIQRLDKALSALYVVSGSDILVARTGALVYTITFRNASARSYKLMTGYAVTGPITLAFVKTTNGVPRTEDAWSATRGYPRSVCFWESRTCFGGTKSLTQTVFLSVTNDPYNFNLGQGLADDAISRTLNTDAVNKVNSVIPAVHLQVFTDASEFFFPNSPLTPENSVVSPQSNYGSSRVQPIRVDSTTAFLDANGTSLRQFNFNQLEQSYQAPSASRLSSFLLNDPIAISAQTTSADDQAAYVYVINSDGSAALLQTLRAEEMLAWTPWTTFNQVVAGVPTDGGFRDVCALRDTVYFLCNRVISGNQYWTMEVLDESMYTDGGIHTTGASAAVWSTPPYLNGYSLRVKGDNQVLPNATAGAATTTISVAVTEVEIGINFNTALQPMPAALISANLAAKNRRARLSELYLHVKSTLGLYVNDYPMDERYLDIEATDTAPTARTGVFLTRLTGWGELQAPLITQVDPLPMNILSIEYTLIIN